MVAITQRFMDQVGDVKHRITDAVSRIRESQPANVGSVERKASVVAGTGLAILGISRLSIPGALLAAFGGALVYRGLSGHCNVYQALGVDRAEPREDDTDESREHEPREPATRRTDTSRRVDASSGSPDSSKSGASQGGQSSQDRSPRREPARDESNQSIVSSTSQPALPAPTKSATPWEQDRV